MKSIQNGKTIISKAIVTILIITFCMVCTAYGVAAAVVKKGDANLDGKIDIDDVLLVRDHIFGTVVLTGNKKEAADVNSDSLINVSDITMINHIIMGSPSFTAVHFDGMQDSCVKRFSQAMDNKQWIPRVTCMK